jgi:VanZ family protein
MQSSGDPLDGIRLWLPHRHAIIHGSNQLGPAGVVRHRIRAFTPAFVWAVAVWIVGGLEQTPSVPGGLGLDKMAHFGMYGVLGFLLARGWVASGWRGAWLLPVAAALLLGVADERRQRSVPGRSADVMDWIADVGGATAGVFIALRRSRRQRLDDSERRSDSITGNAQRLDDRV